MLIYLPPDLAVFILAVQSVIHCPQITERKNGGVETIYFAPAATLGTDAATNYFVPSVGGGVKVKKIYGDGREEIVETLVSRKQLNWLNCGVCAGVDCAKHLCPHNLGTGIDCEMEEFRRRGGRLEEMPAPMIAPMVGEVEIKPRSLYFATMDLHGLAVFSEGKDIVSVSRDCGTNNVTVFFWG